MPLPPSAAPDASPFAERAPESVLILKPSSLGDVVHTLPAVAALKRHWPQTRIRWMVNPEWSPLLEGNPCLDEVLLFPRASFRGALGPLKMLRWAIHFAPKAASELVLDFQCLLRSALIGKLCRKAHFFGLSDAREGARFFYDSTAPVLPTQHAVDRYLALVRKVGVPTPLPLEWPLPSGNLPVDFDLKTPFVVLHPFSRGKGKSLQSAEVESFCRAMAPWRVVVLGRSAEKVAALPNVDNWLNRTTLPELIAIMRQATWVVSVDSGPMHIAAALSPRVLSIHTWSDPRKVGPYPPAAWVWQKGTLFQQGAPAQARPAPLIQDTALWLKEQLAHSSDSPLASR